MKRGVGDDLGDDPRLAAPSFPLLAADRVSFEYPSATSSGPVLHEVSLTLDSGEWIAVMGSSGSGKSTLLKCLGGLLTAQRGEVVLDGVDVVRASEKQLSALRRDRLGFIFQELNLVPALTAEENVGLPARFSGKRPSHKAVLDVLDRVGLREKADSRPDQLSGGQCQRVAIARALISRPAIVFADEPTGSLDVHTSSRFLDELQVLVDDGTAVLMVTHDPNVAARADQVIWLRNGHVVDVVADATSEQIAIHLASLEDAAL